MPGGYYTALSGMHTRLEALDRLAADLANSSTSGYKTERAGTVQADRPSFGVALQSAVDVADGPAKVDMRAGSLASTGRSLDLAIQGNGYFVIDTPAGPRYTRNGHLVRRPDGVLTNDEGDAVLGTDGPISLGLGEIEVQSDGTVYSGGAAAGTLKIVEFDPSADLMRESGSRFRTDAEPTVSTRPSIAAGTLEQSNVSVVDRIAEMSAVTRSFEALLKGVSVLMNDVDSRAISELGRK